MAVEAEYLYCPLTHQLCRAGKVWVDPEEQTTEAFCAFWHRKELRCVLRMMEYDLYNVARALDALRGS